VEQFLMADLVQFARFYRYPYLHWGKAIASLLECANVSAEATFIDAPCGDGVVTFWLVKNGLGRSFELYDISERDVKRAERLKDWPQNRPISINVALDDVHNVPVCAKKTRDVWFVINSLFLLPKIDQLVDHLRPRVEHIVGLFPDVTSRNYRCYKKRNPTINANEMTRDDIREFFSRHGYRQVRTVNASFIPHHCIQPMRVQQIARYALNPFGSLVPRKDPCYWAGLFTRESD
jgi:hypothetical protein